MRPVRDPAPRSVGRTSGSRGWGAIFCLALGTLWLGFILLPALTGYAPTASVAEGRDVDGFCQVTWATSDGRGLRGESDCPDEPAGATFQVWVAGWPLDPEPATPGSVLRLALVPGLPLIVGGSLRLVLLRHRRPVPGEPDADGMPLSLVPAPATDDSAGTVRPPDGPALAVGATGAEVSSRLRRAWALVALGVVTTCALAALFVVLDRIAADFHATSAHTRGTVVSLKEDSRASPGSARVEYTVGGQQYDGKVTLYDEVSHYVADQEVRVRYDPDRPDRFTIDDVDYEPAWWPLVGYPLFLGSGLTLPYGLWWAVTHLRTRRLLKNHSWTPVGVRAFLDDPHCWFVASDGTIWRANQNSFRAWISASRELWSPTSPEDGDGSVWWVSDGDTAVFSPDAGATLVRAGRRNGLPHDVWQQPT